MGKAGKDQTESTLPSSFSSSSSSSSSSSHEHDDGSGFPQLRSVGRIVRPRCIVALVLGAAMLLSVLFWLPPFLRHSGGNRGRIRDPSLTADIVASFKLSKPPAVLHANITKLRLDIFEEIGVPNTSVSIISLEPWGANWTNVIFGIWPYPKSSNILSAGLSILRSSFMSLVIRQSNLHLTDSLFGNTSFFEVLKFPGGITIIPPQNAFLLQKVHMLFSFTLNFPIYQVQGSIKELKDQMKLGLLLNSNENLYVKLTNLEGSTLAPPTIVHTSIVLAVGNHQPSLPRLKQLANNIRNSSVGNLGLNHTLFGKVKQIRLSSFLQRSLTSGGSNSSPSPAPQPYLKHHVHHPHHHSHHHSHDPDLDEAPAMAPSLSNHQSQAPDACQYGFPGRPENKDNIAPALVPAAHAGAPSSAVPLTAPRHLLAPHGSKDHIVLPASPSPFPSQPGKSVTTNEARDQAPSTSYVSYPSSTSFKHAPNRVLSLIILLAIL